MKKLLLLAGAPLALAATPAHALYLPNGPQTNVSLATVTGGGWTLCDSGTMAQAFGNSAAVRLANCTGDRILLAGRETGSNTLLALAQTLKVDALFNTGAANNNVFHTADGSDWFNADQWSWGFKRVGDSLTKLQCDSTPPNASMCIHTFNFVGGFSINGITTTGSNYERLVFTANSAPGVPEPATWALLIAGFGMVGGAMRRRQTVSVTYA